MTGPRNGILGPLKHVNAGVRYRLCRSRGRRMAPVLGFSTGWPDIQFVDAAPILAAAGYRVLVPYLRGYGETRFLSDVDACNAQPAAVAADAISFMDALKIEKAIVGI